MTEPVSASPHCARCLKPVAPAGEQVRTSPSFRALDAIQARVPLCASCLLKIAPEEAHELAEHATLSNCIRCGGPVTMADLPPGTQLDPDGRHFLVCHGCAYQARERILHDIVHPQHEGQVKAMWIGAFIFAAMVGLVVVAAGVIKLVRMISEVH